jgi:hypothetical protein
VTRARNARRLASFWHTGMPARTVDVDVAAQVEPDVPEAEHGLRYGYTLDDLDRLARVACQTAHTMAADVGDRYAEAYGEIAVYLYTADVWPSEPDLIRVGQAAIRDWSRATRRAHGLHADSDKGEGIPHATVAYWWAQSSVTPSPEARIVDLAAFKAIWPSLHAEGRNALETIAAFDGDYRQAAGALGLTFTQIRRHVDRAVRLFLALWHEGESPSKVWRQLYRRVEPAELVPCGTPSAYHRHRRRKEPTCQPCRDALGRARQERLARRAT